MKKTICLILAMLMSLTCVTFTACGDDQNASSPVDSQISSEEPDNSPLSKDKTYSFLFVGNSYTYYNYTAAMFKNIALSMGYDVVIEQVIQGSHTLEQFNDPMDQEDTGGGDGTGMDLNYALSDGGPFDYVFLQEQSTRPAVERQRFLDAVSGLKYKIEEVGAKPVLYETWGHCDGHSWLAQNDFTTKTHMEALHASYKYAGSSLNLLVSYAGTAMYKVYSEHPEITIYHTDKKHPSFTGSYLIALSHFATIFRVDPTLVNFIPTVDDADYEDYPRAVVNTARDISDETATILKEAAKYAYIANYGEFLY